MRGTVWIEKCVFLSYSMRAPKTLVLIPIDRPYIHGYEFITS